MLDALEAVKKKEEEVGSVLAPFAIPLPEAGGESDLEKV